MGKNVDIKVLTPETKEFIKKHKYVIRKHEYIFGKDEESLIGVVLSDKL